MEVWDNVYNVNEGHNNTSSIATNVQQADAFLVSIPWPMFTDIFAQFG